MTAALDGYMANLARDHGLGIVNRPATMFLEPRAS